MYAQIDKSDFQVTIKARAQGGDTSTLKGHEIYAVLKKFQRSRRALAVPATFLILFVSTLGLVAVTYYFAVEKVNARSQTLKVVTAKQDFLSLDEKVTSVVWQPGSSRIFEISDSGGRLVVQPFSSSISIEITDGGTLSETVFAGNTGQICYELPYSDSPETGLFLRGDKRTITNQSGSTTTQLSIESGIEHPEIRLDYRPTVSYSVGGVEAGKTVNNIRIYVINLNTSDSFALYGKIPLRISCESVQISDQEFSVAPGVESTTINCSIDSTSGKVTIPISSSFDGAVVDVEVVQCNVKVARSVL